MLFFFWLLLFIVRIRKLFKIECRKAFRSHLLTIENNISNFYYFSRIIFVREIPIHQIHNTCLYEVQC